MKRAEASIEQLHETIKDLRTRFLRLKDDALFTLWFLRAYLSESETEAAAAICGITSDKGTDAVFADDKARTVFIVQSKYRAVLGGKAEKRSDVIEFAEVGVRLADPNIEHFREFQSKLDDAVSSRLNDARTKILQKHYKLAMVYVTLGTCSKPTQDDARSTLRRSECDARLEVLDGTRLLQLHRDYLDGVAPPVPTLDLETENNADAHVTGILQRYDSRTSIEAWTFPMRGDAVADLFLAAGLRLFARNIRGFLGPTGAINREIVKTLRRDPQHFFYYNNGVTIVCDHAEKRSHKGKDIIQVSNPQVINGQQTTRTLAGHRTEAAKATVLVKVIQVPRSKENDFESLVSRIVAGTNWQNAIKPSDLMSNDRMQVELERELRKHNYFYVRKRQSKSEIREETGGRYAAIISKEELAQTIAACELDPLMARTQQEGLFGENTYQQVFPNSDALYYLPRYWIMIAGRSVSRGNDDLKKNTRWLAVHVMWCSISQSLRGIRRARQFDTLCRENQAATWKAINSSFNEIFKGIAAYFRSNRIIDGKRLDAAQFSKNSIAKGSAFNAFWNSHICDKWRNTVSRECLKIEAILDSEE